MGRTAFLLIACVQGEALDANLQLAAKAAAIAERKGCTPAQLALAWLLAQGHDIVPIPGEPHCF